MALALNPLASTQDSRQASLPCEQAQPPRPPLPRSLASVVIVAWTVRLAAAINFVAFTMHHAPRFIYWLSGWVPFEISVGRRLLMLLTALLLFTLASGLERGKRQAWLLSLLALSAAPFIHTGRMIIWPQILLNIPLIVLLCVNRHYFAARSDRRAVSRAFTICPLLLVMLLAGGTLRLHEIRHQTTGPDSWLGCLQAAGELILVQNSHAQKAQTIAALHTFSVLRIGGTSIALLALVLALRPVAPSRQPTQDELEQAKRIINEYSHDPVDAYALLPEKSLFISSDRSVIVPYAVSRRFAVALGDPVGPRDAKARAVDEFAGFCRRRDWIPLFYQASPNLLPAYYERQFAAVKIAEDARLKAFSFDLRGRDFQNLRTLCNHARKQGISFVWHGAETPLDPAMARQIQAISSAWLERKKGAEMGFDMGTFSLGDLSRFGAGLALDSENRVLAFTTWRPFANGRGRVLDLMRSGPNVRSVLDFVLVQSIQHFARQGVSEISLGSAPLADAGGGPDPDQTESRLIRFVYENLNQLYAYKPLFEFKRKYRPDWQPRYLVYPAGESLPLIGLALVGVHAPNGSWKFLKFIQRGTTAFSGLSSIKEKFAA